MRPYVKHVYSNLKSPMPEGEAWQVELSQRTLFVGSNTSHKSSVIQSVELALAGSADDIFGRSAVSDAALLLTLAPKDELGITATLSNSKTASFNVKREGTKVKRPTHDGPGAGSLVHRSVAAALSGSPASARKAFLGWSGGNVDLNRVLQYLPDSMHSKYKDIAQFKGRGKTAVETLIDVAAYAGQKQREAAKEAKGAEILLNGINNELDARPDDDDMVRMRSAVAQAKMILDRSVRAGKQGMTLEEKNKKIDSIKSMLEFLESKRLNAVHERDQLQNSLPSKGENVDHAIAIVDVAVKHGLDACPVCSSKVGLDHLKNCQSFYQQQADQWQRQSKGTMESIQNFENNIRTYEADIAIHREKLQETEAVKPNQKDPNVIPVVDATARLEAAMDAMTKMDHAVAQWDSFQRARGKVIRMKEDVETYKSMKKECESAIGMLLNDQTKTFSNKVQKYLPEDWKFNIELIDGDREVFRMGIMRGDKLHAALSGAEWTSVVTAISMAVVEGLGEDQPAVLIPEDRAWDGKTLASVMRGFSNFDGQVVMASTTRPVGKTPKGWTIVEMDKLIESWTTSEVDEEEAPVEDAPTVSKTSINHASGGFRVTTRTAIMLETLGYRTDVIQSMSRDTVAELIRQQIPPENVCVTEDGGFYIRKGGNVLPMPPAPKV